MGKHDFAFKKTRPLASQRHMGGRSIQTLWSLPVVSIVCSFLGLPFRVPNIELVKPKKGTTMETIGISGDGK